MTADWSRPFWKQTDRPASLFYFVPGEPPTAGLELSQSRHHVEGFPEALQLSGHERGRVGGDLIGGGGGHEDQVQLGRVEARSLQGQRAGPGGEVAQPLPILRPRARGGAGALADPILVDPHMSGDLGIGDTALGNGHGHRAQGGAAVTGWR